MTSASREHWVASEFLKAAHLDKPQSPGSTPPACCCLFSAFQIQPTVIWNSLCSSAQIFILFLPGPFWRSFFTQCSAPFRQIPVSAFKSRGKGRKLLKYTLKMLEYAPVQQEVPCYSQPSTLFRTCICISISAEESSNSHPLPSAASLYMANVCKYCP